MHRCQLAESGSHPQGRGPQSGEYGSPSLTVTTGTSALSPRSVPPSVSWNSQSPVSSFSTLMSAGLSNRERAERVLHSERACRVRSCHANDVFKREAQRHEAREHLGHAVDGVHASRRSHVGADAARLHALVECGLCHVEAEVLPSVRGVEEHAAMLRFQNLADDLAVAVDDAARIAAEEVGDDVAVLKQGQQAGA